MSITFKSKFRDTEERRRFRVLSCPPRVYTKRTLRENVRDCLLCIPVLVGGLTMLEGLAQYSSNGEIWDRMKSTRVWENYVGNSFLSTMVEGSLELNPLVDYRRERSGR